MLAKIDKLGRIVIPKEYREKLGISLGDKVDMSISDEALTIKPKVNRCCICQGRLAAAADVPLCEKCLDNIKSL